jgi:phosphomevalonate kinase
VIARAPGKIVLSGAYAVLEKAPAIVTAVDRYVVADSKRAAAFVTPEVRAALGEKPAPWFDASALRSGDKKLGLGSSAAILVASLGAVRASAGTFATADELRAVVLEPAIVAHRTAQGGGSGIDVAASVHGGTIIARRTGTTLDVRAAALPADLFIEVLFAGMPSMTSELLGRVRAFKARSPHEYAGVMEDLTAAAEDAERSLDEGTASGMIRALAAQLRGLTDLGEHARAKIVTREVARLNDLAVEEDALVIPAGAGGGDVAIYVGLRPPSDRLVAAFNAERHERLGLALGAEGLKLVDSQ